MIKLALLVLAPFALLALRSDDQSDVIRIAVARILDERTTDPSLRSTLVVDTVLRCGTGICTSSLPAAVRVFLTDTAGVQLGSTDSVVVCDLETYPRKCQLRGGSAALRLQHLRMVFDTAWISYTWTELHRGNYYGRGEEWQFMRSRGRWIFDRRVMAWST